MLGVRKSILIVDDKLDNLRALSAILSRHNYRVRKADSGETALETIRAELPDLILLDICMPQMDGYAVCAALKASAETCQIPIIFLTALDEIGDKIKAFEVGAADYITKPFHAEEVLIRVSHQLTIQEQQRQINNHNRRLQQEINDRKQAEAETLLLLTTIYAVNQARNFHEALQAILSQVREIIRWEYGEAWTTEQEGTVLYLIQASYDESDPLLEEFEQKSSALTICFNMGWLGRVWATQQPEWVEDVSQAEKAIFLRTKAAIASGLKTALAVPIVLDGQVLAVLVFFKRSRAPYDAKLMQLVNAVALQLGVFVSRIRAEESLRLANQRLQRLANLDGLTQVANRRYFDEVLDMEWLRLRREQLPLSLILCDIDYFKLYNDTYGHLAGDDCLRQVTQAIAKTIKRPADLLARYGGEEFVMLLPNTDIDGAIHMARQVQLEVANLAIPHSASRTSNYVTLSMGIASTVPILENEPKNLIAAADRALYAAKTKGRNTFDVGQLTLDILPRHSEA